MRDAAFLTVRTEGGLLPADLLLRIVRGDNLEGLTEGSYHLAEGERLREMISRSWNRLTGVWASFRAAADKLPASDTGTTLTRERWLLILFEELGYGRLQTARAIHAGGRDYPVSHRWGRVPIHLVSLRQDLDRRTPGAVGAARAPHSMVQEMLNRSDEHLWAFVSNGHLLRLLRDNSSLTRQAFVEFDLAGMMEGEQYADFVLLWLLCHQSRVEGDPPQTCWLERWVETAHQEGTRALDQLRDGVEQALTTLGTGFLSHPGNGTLREDLRSGQLSGQELYRHLLRLVYRLLFLFVTEDRDLLLLPDTEPQARERYQRFYSTRRLRDLASRLTGSNHGDLWEGLRLTMGFFGSEGCPALALPPLGGFLWASDALGPLEQSRLSNRHLLEGMRRLAYRSDARVRRPVDYRNLGPEELGSVYEALLELHPEVNLPLRTFSLGGGAGSERKTTGSYYTPTPLISLILDEALDPLIDEAVAGKSGAEAEQAILALRVCDPAVGSAHFLVAAAHRLAKRLAAVRVSEGEPSPAEQRRALREVVGHCLFGVDINPMAVELAKVSLWLEATSPGVPLTFLDHHVKCGNSIIGATPALIAGGIPDDAFRDVEGDDKAACRKYRERNRRLRGGQRPLGLGPVEEAQIASMAGALAAMPDDDLESLVEKERSFREMEEAPALAHQRLTADAWCAAVTYPKVSSQAGKLQPFDLFYALRDGAALTADLKAAQETVEQEAVRFRFFHWHLEFPEVFRPAAVPAAGDGPGWKGGFDLVLGNPPWDTLSPDEKEFFASYIESVAGLSADDRQGAMEDAFSENPVLKERWLEHRHDLFATAHFFRHSGRYRLFAEGNLGKGDYNLYRAFVELALSSARPGGLASQVTPAGLYNGANAAAIRGRLFDGCDLRWLFGFVNEAGSWFPGIDPSTRFSVYAARIGGITRRFLSAFKVAHPLELAQARAEPYEYSVSDIREASPEALLVVEVNPGADARVLTKLTRGRPSFKKQNAGRGWHPYRREVDMGNDQHLFTTSPPGLPVYEGRMVDFYDHRAKNYVSGAGRSSTWDEYPFSSPRKGIHPHWYLPRRSVPAKLGDAAERYRLGFLDVVNPERGRCLTAAVVPPDTVCGHKVPTISFEPGEEWRYAIWLVAANSFCLDYLARKRVALSMSFSAMDSLPFPAVEPVSEVGRALIHRALRLTCVSPEMEEFGNLVRSSAHLPRGLGKPPCVDPNERELLRAEIDAIVARDIFGLTLEELAFILDTFEALARSEEREHGEFRSKRLVLEAFDRVELTDG